MNNFKKALTARGLDVNSASKASGIGYDTIWKHALGLREVSPAMALRYETLLGIPRHELRPDLWPVPVPLPETIPSASTLGNYHGESLS